MKLKKLNRSELIDVLVIIEDAMERQDREWIEFRSTQPTCFLLTWTPCAMEIIPIKNNVIAFYQYIMQVNSMVSFRDKLKNLYGDIHTEYEIYELRQTALALLHAIISLKLSKKTTGF